MEHGVHTQHVMGISGKLETDVMVVLVHLEAQETGKKKVAPEAAMEVIAKVKEMEEGAVEIKETGEIDGMEMEETVIKDQKR